MNAPQYISVTGGQLHYYRFGQGPELVFAFHGYGEEGLSFSELAEVLGPTYTLIALEMPFHGQSLWQGPLFFPPEQLAGILENLAGSQPFSLLGYSMGGRISLQLLQMIPDKIKGLVLIAPDGLHRNPWQWIATRTWLGNRIFRFTMQHPAWLFGLMRLGVALGFFQPGIRKFAMYYLGEAAARHILYQRWTTMRGFRPAITTLRKNINTHPIQVQMLFGKYDRIILSKNASRLSRGLETKVTTRIEATGHQLLRPDYFTLIREMLVIVSQSRL